MSLIKKIMCRETQLYAVETPILMLQKISEIQQTITQFLRDLPLLKQPLLYKHLL